jgi:predicted RNase H-like nuclease (RuvC/YqgF family)
MTTSCQLELKPSETFKADKKKVETRREQIDSLHATIEERDEEIQELKERFESLNDYLPP